MVPVVRIQQKDRRASLHGPGELILLTLERQKHTLSIVMYLQSSECEKMYCVVYSNLTRCAMYLLDRLYVIIQLAWIMQ